MIGGGIVLVWSLSEDYVSDYIILGFYYEGEETALDDLRHVEILL